MPTVEKRPVISQHPGDSQDDGDDLAVVSIAYVPAGLNLPGGLVSVLGVVGKLSGLNWAAADQGAVVVTTTATLAAASTYLTRPTIATICEILMQSPLRTISCCRELSREVLQKY